MGRQRSSLVGAQRRFDGGAGTGFVGASIGVGACARASGVALGRAGLVGAGGALLAPAVLGAGGAVVTATGVGRARRRFVGRAEVGIEVALDG